MNYTYVHDVMTVWQGPEAGHTGSSFIQGGVHINVSRFKESRPERLDMLSIAHLLDNKPKARISLENHSNDFGI